MSWTNFGDEVSEQARTNPNWGCKVCKLLEGVNDEERKAIQAVLDNPAISTRSIHDAFRVRGIRADRDRVQAHRQGKC